jgi:hypothetical protein
MTILGDFKKGLAGLVQTAAGAPMPVVHQFSDLFAAFIKAAADGAAATPTADTLFYSNPYDFTMYVVSAKFTPTGAGITADNVNFATLAVKTNDGAGGATATAASITTAITDSGNFTQNQSKSFTLITGANIAVPPGGGLWLNIAKAAAGVVVPAGFFTVRLQRAEG